VALDYNDTFPKEIHTYLTLLAHSNSTMNPFLYFYTNPAFNFRKLIKRGKSPETSVSFAARFKSEKDAYTLSKLNDKMTSSNKPIIETNS
jgi:hypothetical protein